MERMRRLFALWIAVFSFYGWLYGQQLNQLSMTIFHPYKDYSAYAGFDRSINLTIISRNQWNGIQGDPKMQYGAVHLPLYAIKSGLGVDLSNISEGNFKYNYLRSSFNKVVDLPNGVLSLGGRLGLYNVSFGTQGVLTPEGIYTSTSIDHKDPLLPGSISDVGIGWELSAWFRGRQLQGGLSISDQPTTILDPKGAGFIFDKNINMFLSSFYDITETIQLQPFINIKSNFNVTQTEIAGIGRINGNIFVGLMFRGYSSSSVDALGFILGHKFSKRYSLYYNYDAGLSNLRKTNEGSHEIIMKIDFYNLPKSGLPPKVIYNPRYLE
jgi:type IX secretion system PorP/SprF family membrane protein